MKVHAVLLMPPAGDPHELLQEGPCGARPPKAWRCDERYHRLKTDHGRWFSMSEAHLPALESGGDALVLAWGGCGPVAEGMDRAARCWEAVTEESGRGLEAYGLWWCRLVDAVNLAHECQYHGLGTVVLLDAEGREVSDDKPRIQWSATPMPTTRTLKGALKVTEEDLLKDDPVPFFGRPSEVVEQIMEIEDKRILSLLDDFLNEEEE